jgi:hypothetical protein
LLGLSGGRYQLAMLGERGSHAKGSKETGGAK